MPQIFAFGDSITYGAWDVKSSGWVALLRKYLDDRAEQDPNFYSITYNLGIPGESTDGLGKRFPSEVETRLRTGEDSKSYIFIFAYGANDTGFITSQNKFKVEIEEYRKNIESIILSAKKYSSKILLLTTTPVIEHQLKSQVKVRRNEYIEKYNQELSELTKQYNVDLLDIYTVFRQNRVLELFDADGLHPNTKGHQLIFESVQKALDKLL